MPSSPLRPTTKLIIIFLGGFVSIGLITAGCSSDSASNDRAGTEIEADSSSDPSTGTGDNSPESSEEPETAAVDAASSDDSSTDDPGESTGDADELYPDVVDATASTEGGGLWTISATLSSPYDSPDRYADSWRVLGPDGTVYGERFLTHDHANEQPFTRSQSGIKIPSEVTTVTIEGRDQVSGWGGETFELTLPAQ